MLLFSVSQTQKYFNSVAVLITDGKIFVFLYPGYDPTDLIFTFMYYIIRFSIFLNFIYEREIV